MNKNKTIQISDTIHGSIRLNYLEKQVISTQIFNRLHNISQNSTVYLTFPTNRTKRFEHSIGTMSLCGKMFQESISNADSETLEEFFKAIEKIIDSEIKDNLSNYETKYRSKIGDTNLSESKLIIYKNAKIPNEYNSFIPVNVEERYRNTYVILFQSVRLSALMHDVGHPPFSHITEFALKNIWSKILEIDSGIRNARQRKYISSMQKYFESKEDLHEQIGNKITDKVLDNIIENIPKAKERDKRVLEQQLFKVLVCEITSAILQEKHTAFADLHRIIDGTLDGDRLDYVSRDPINSGLNVGMIEYDRIISSMRLVKEGDNFLFAPSSKVIDSIEDFFNRRWKMYKQIIYHHRVIKTDYLLQSCIEDLAVEYLQDDNEEEECGNILPYDISGLWKAIEYKPSHQDFFDSLIQWDDGWLMTIMKKQYFLTYLNFNSGNTVYKLEELLANKKNYFSLIKRMEDFIPIDKQVAKVMLEEYDVINKLVKSIQESRVQENGNIVVEVDPLFNYILRLEDSIKKYNSDTSYIPKDGFILAKIKKIYNNLFEEDWFEQIIYNSVEEIKENNFKDKITIIKKVKTGTQGGKTWAQGGLGLYGESNGELRITSFLNLSNEANILATDVSFMPVFYMYILKDTEYINYEDIKISLGKMIGKQIANKIKVKLEELN